MLGWDVVLVLLEFLVKLIVQTFMVNIYILAN